MYRISDKIKTKMKRILIPLLLFLYPAITFSQSLELGFGVGAVNYWGDLNAPSFSTNMTNARFGFQLNGRIFYSNKIAARVNLLVGSLHGDDSKSDVQWQLERNLNFSSRVFDLAVMGEYYLFGYDHSDAESIFSPYLTAGVSVFTFNPYTEYLGQEIELQPLGTEGQGLPGYDDFYSTTSFSLVFGGGAKVKLSEKFSINLDLLAHRTFTDYIDDVSGVYADYFLLRDRDPLAANLSDRSDEYFGQAEESIPETGSQRGGEDVKDYFLTGMITFNFVIGNNGFRLGKSGYHGQCPTF